ncbi:hypothetical protein [Corynebacterium heidelbergense]|uniref:hypothetical protein n=1 Tax=Corynebacterium heidelbergense TaxID=2055947 RepID=UPI000DDA5B41|nr:hypothetical protein [Corynebacterium heidelbergense]WCZ36095.1 hypothetical protein CHEID_02650 [Corynebacterium heidelbergense]
MSEIERWVLQHPKLGKLEVLVGTAAQLRAEDEGFPADVAKKQPGKADVILNAAANPVGLVARKLPHKGSVKSAAGEVTSTNNKDRNPGSDRQEPRHIIVRRDGRVLARWEDIADRSVGVGKSQKGPEPGKFSGFGAGGGSPRLDIEVSLTREWVREVTLRHGKEVVVFDAPAGSRAQWRQEEMAASPFKRWLFPILAGMGKGGWAVVVLVLGPLVGRLIDWVLSFLPDFDIPWPHINWPHINWPHIDWPDIHLPHINWPHIPFPHIELPDWVVWTMEHQRIWMPIVLGIFIGIGAVRRHKRSQRVKQEWQEGSGAGQPPSERDDGETAVGGEQRELSPTGRTRQEELERLAADMRSLGTRGFAKRRHPE